ncbi:hypothetical protein D3C78_1225310 [compost metagenome]
MISRAAEEAGSRARHHDAAIALGEHVRPGGVSHVPATHGVDAHDALQILDLGTGERAQLGVIAGVVNHDINAAITCNGFSHHGVHLGTVAYVTARRPSGTTRGSDGGHYFVGRAGIVAVFATQTATVVVDHDLGSTFSEKQGVLTANAATRAGDEDHLVVECEHFLSSG